MDKPSTNLTNSEINKVIKGMKMMKDLYEEYDLSQKKQFLRFFIRKVFVDAETNKIVQYELVPEFEELVSGDLVRITSNWLARWDDFRTFEIEYSDVLLKECEVLVRV